MKAKDYKRIVRKAAKTAAHLGLRVLLVIALFVTSTIPFAQPKRAWAQEPEKEPGPPPEVIDFEIPLVDLAAYAAVYHPPTGPEAEGSCFPVVGYYFFEDGTPLLDNEFVEVDTEDGRQFLYLGEFLDHPTLGWHIKIHPIEDLSIFYWVDGCKALLGDDSCESNQTPSSPCHIGISPVSHGGMIMKLTDYDYVRAWVPEGQEVKWELYGLSKDLDMDAWAWDGKASQWEFLGRSVKSGTQQEAVFTPVNGEALIVVRIYAYEDPEGGTSYSLELTNTLSEELADVQASLRVLNKPFSASVSISSAEDVEAAAAECSESELTGSWLWQPTPEVAATSEDTDATMAINTTVDTIASSSSVVTATDVTTETADASSVVTNTTVVTGTQLSWCGWPSCIALPIIMKPEESLLACFPVPKTTALHEEDGGLYAITAQADEFGTGMLKVDASSVEKATKEHLPIGKSVQSDWALFPSPAFSPDYAEHVAKFLVLLPLGSGMDPFSLSRRLDATGWWLQMIWDGWDPRLTPTSLIPYPPGGPFFSRWDSTSSRWMFASCPGICPGIGDLYIQLAFFDRDGKPNSEFLAVNSDGDMLIQVHFWRYIPATDTFKLVSYPCEICMGDYTYVDVGSILLVSAAAAELWLFANSASEQNESNWQNYRPPSSLSPQPVFNMRILYGLAAFGFGLIAIATWGPDPTDIGWLTAANYFGKMALSPQQRLAIYEQAAAAVKAKLNSGAIVSQEDLDPLEAAAWQGLLEEEAVLPSPTQVENPAKRKRDE